MTVTIRLYVGTQHQILNSLNNYVFLFVYKKRKLIYSNINPFGKLSMKFKIFLHDESKEKCPQFAGIFNYFFA